MVRGLAAMLLGALLLQEGPDSASEKARLHEDLASAAGTVGEHLIKLKAWDEARAFLELIRAKSDARAAALDDLITKAEKQTSGLKWEPKPSDLIKAFGREQAKPFLAFAKAWKEKDKEASRWTEAEGEILDDLLDYVKAYARLTQIRAHYELPKTRFDWKLSVPAHWHAEYKRLNPTDGKEVQDKPGYSPEGRLSGEHSITSRRESLTELLEAIIHGPFHRTMILHPSLTATGFGQSNGSIVGSVIDVYSSLDQSTLPDNPLAIPPNNATSIPPAGFDDNLGVIPNYSLRDLGYPITLTFFTTTATPKRVKARIMERLKEVDFYLSTPEKPALPKRYPDNRNSVVIIPKAPLKTMTEYTVQVTYTLSEVQRSLEWRFKTGR